VIAGAVGACAAGALGDTTSPIKQPTRPNPNHNRKPTPNPHIRTQVLVWRMYLGWDHVGARLQSAKIEYEETGWYDGQIWIKTPEILTRDRLAVAYKIRPAMSRLKSTLVGLGGALAASVVLLAALPPPQAQSALYVAPAAAPGVASAAVAGDGRSYEERLREFEPWAVEGEGEGGEGAVAGRPTLLDHMRASA